MCLILPHYLETTFPRKLQFVIAMVGFGFTSFLMGPSDILGFPTTNYWFICAAFPVMGIFQYFVFIPIIPEMLERMQVDLGVVEGEDEAMDNAINDKVNDAYGLIYALSNFVAPLIGSMMYSQFGSPKSCDYLAFANFGLCILFFIFNCGIFCF